MSFRVVVLAYRYHRLMVEDSEKQWQYSDSIDIAVEPEALYDMVSDPRRTGEWSPICRGGDWKNGGTGTVGDVFTGRNVVGEAEWTTLSEVLVADYPREFAWLVAPDRGGVARWSYIIEPTDYGSRLTETWHVLPTGREWLRENRGEDAPDQRRQAALRGIPETLAAIKRVAENEAANGC